MRIDNGLAMMLQFENVAWYEDGVVKILDRRIYPVEINFVVCKTHKEVAKAIADMVTQSAGPYTAAGMGMALAAYESRKLKEKDQLEYLQKAADLLSTARPTTYVRMKQVVDGCLSAVENKLGEEADKVIFQHTVDAMTNRYQKIELVANHLVDLFPKQGKVMTQCFGETIVGMMLRKARVEKKNISLYCPETRPFLQGARLTASVAKDMGYDVTVITDNMPASVIEKENIDLFTSAADVICLDGSVVNKVGTLQIAIVCKYFGIPYFVTGIPDKEHKKGNDVEIEYRNPEEVLSYMGKKHTLKGVQGYYPAFDVTPSHLVSGVVTDQGVFSPYDLMNYEIKSQGFYSFAV